MKILICLLLSFHVSFGILRTVDDTTGEPSVTENSTSTTTAATEAPSSSIDNDPQQLFSTSVSALIDVVKTKLVESINITLSDAVVNAITAPDLPALVRKNTKVKADASKSTERLVVPKANGPGNRKRPAQKPNKATSGARGEPELLEASEVVDEVAKDKQEPAQIDDAKSAAVEKSDDQQRSSRQRKQSSKRPNLQRQAGPSNAVMVGFNEIAVGEVAFRKSKGPRTRATVTIQSTSGPIRVLLSLNSSQVPVATYSISAPIVIQIGQDNTRSQNNVILKDIRKKQLKTIDLKIDDALKNKPGIILNEIKQLIRSANFDQLLKESFTAALQEESVMKKFIDASNSNFTRKQTKVT